MFAAGRPVTTADWALFEKHIESDKSSKAFSGFYSMPVSHFERGNSTINNYRWSPGTVLSSTVASCIINLVLHRYYQCWLIDSWLAKYLLGH